MLTSRLQKIQKFLRARWKAVVAVAIGLIAFGLGYGYLATPAAIRQPRFEHAHVRLQIIAEGQEVDFGEDKFQTPYDKDMCSDELTAQPIHFHDNKNQFIHLHWKGMTGGLILKYYGWNLIGGLPDALGYRLDDLPSIKKVPVFGKVLPDQLKDKNVKLWVYTGDEGNYQKRELNDFLQQDIETFLGKKSNVNNPQAGLWQRLFAARAAAHAGEVHGNEAESKAHEAAEPADNSKNEAEGQLDLAEINNLLGNIVVFAQADEPNDEQVKERFHRLEPLGESTCGG